MSKKFGKFLLFSAVAGVAAYGAYHYLQTKDLAPSSPGDDDTDDDFDDFSEDLEEAEADNPAKDRSYVSLNLDKAEAIAQEAFHKAKEVITDSVHQVKETVRSVKESQMPSEGNFTDLTAINKEAQAGQDDPAKSTESATQEEAAPSDGKTETPFTAQDTENADIEAPNSDISPEQAAATDNPSGTIEEFYDDEQANTPQQG